MIPILTFHICIIADVLRVLKAQLSDPTNVLQSWDPISVSPCSWYHVTCDSWNRSVTRV